jgi:hypothetical protein
LSATAQRGPCCILRTELRVVQQIGAPSLKDLKPSMMVSA